MGDRAHGHTEKCILILNTYVHELAVFFSQALCNAFFSHIFLSAAVDIH